MERQPISREGYDKIREEIRVMEEVDMPAIAERIKTAREEGDLKENAEYHAARETQGYMQAKINQLKSKLVLAVISSNETISQRTPSASARRKGPRSFRRF
jgi:transcription elongation factor GreA